EVEFRRHLLIALLQPPPPRMQAVPCGTGEEAQIEHHRDDQQDDQHPATGPSGRRAADRAGRRRAHVCVPSVRSRIKPAEGSRNSRRKPSSPPPWRIWAKESEVSAPSVKPSQLATAI